MYRVPEVEIRLPFRDPSHRIQTFMDCKRMMDWSYKGNYASLVYAGQEELQMVFKFAFNSAPMAKAFDKKFDPWPDDELVVDLRFDLADVVRAWESLPGGESYSSNVIQDWLIVNMKPAIDRARIALGREPGKRHNA